MNLKVAARVALVCLPATISVVLSAAEWYVDASMEESGDGTSWQTAFKAIQEGIDAASDDDIVTVAEGTYLENIHFQGKNIPLTSTFPQDPTVVGNTVIDGNQGGAVVTFSGTEDGSCVLSGFTLRNGKAFQGGGIHGGYGQATIHHNVITGNEAEYRGGGLYGCHGEIRNNIITANSAHKIDRASSGCGAGLYNCDGLILNNTVSGNTAEGNGGGLNNCDGTIQGNIISGNDAEYGGGLALCGGMIQNNTISDNTASYEGGGLSHCDGMIQTNTISENSARKDEGGGLAYCDGIIQHNTITGNSADYGGGVSYCQGNVRNNLISGNSALRGGGITFCNGTIHNNTITGNSAQRSGGGLYYCNGTIDGNVISENSASFEGGGLSDCWAVIQNNLIAGNSAASYGGGMVSCAGAIHNNTIANNSAGTRGGGLERCQGTIANCILWGNTALQGDQVSLSSLPIYCCIQGWTGNGEGNLTQDPLFVAAAEGDYRLLPQSPCINAAAHFYWCAWPQRDLEGNARLAAERIDMGCYESGAMPDTDGDLLCDQNELLLGTDPFRGDTDEDGLRDGLERLRGTDPKSPTPPGILHVPTDVPRIQAALILGVNGEEIVVAPGTYHENLFFSGAEVVLRSSDPEDADVVSSTILDGEEAGAVVSFSGGESEACILSGFTITGGLTDSGAGIRGGPPGTSTRATIQNNVIVGNRASRKGGGLWGCDGVIRRNTITGNYALRHGGGLAYCNGTIRNNTIAHNTAGGCGGGLYSCGGLIENNTITANIAEGTFVWRGRVYGDGGGMTLCDGTIRNNGLTGNWALNGGAAYACSATFANNTIAGNHAENYGGAMDSCKGCVILNCIIWGNTASDAAQLYNSNPVLLSSCVQGLAGGGKTNIAADPRFVDPDGPDDDPDTPQDNDYRLSPNSPCIDAGANEEWMWQAVDLDDNPRILSGTSSSLRVDMGAFECTSAGPSQGISYVDASVSASGDGASWETAFATIQEGLQAASNGYMVIVAPGTYFENIRFEGKNLILRCTDPSDPEVVSATVIDGGRAGPTVTFLGTENESCLLAGFTIRLGKAPYGGGICGGNTGTRTHATIRSNVITANNADHGGGFAFCDGVIQDNVISMNSTTYQYGEGGGLTLCDGTIQNNTIRKNSSAWRGGGLSRCNGTIQNNTVSDNSASSGGGLAYCHGWIQGNKINGNTARIWGGGLHWCNGTIQNNTITANSARDTGGGLAFCDGTIRNNTIIANSAQTAGGGLGKCEGTVVNCILWQNNPDQVYHDPYGPKPLLAYSCIQDWNGDGEGNLAENPQLTAEFRLSAISPCIDTGLNEDWMRKAVDMDGNPRIFLGLHSFTVDMGAYEYGSFAFRLVEIAGTGSGERQLVWTSQPRDTYVIWSCPDLTTATWSIEATMHSEEELTTWTDSDTTSRCKFYRIGIE